MDGWGAQNIWRKIREKLLLPTVEKSPLKWLKHLIRYPPCASILGWTPTGKIPLWYAQNTLEGLEDELGNGYMGKPWFALDKQREIDGWMAGWQEGICRVGTRALNYLLSALFFWSDRLQKDERRALIPQNFLDTSAGFSYFRCDLEWVVVEPRFQGPSDPCAWPVASRTKHLNLKWQKPCMRKKLFNLYFLLWSMSHPLVKEAGSMLPRSAASHQGVIKMFWLHFWGTVMSLISLWMVLVIWTRKKLISLLGWIGQACRAWLSKACVEVFIILSTDQYYKCSFFVIILA